VSQSRPAADEVELSVFGSGIGEGLAIHIGDGDWIAIDSCIARETGQPAILSYFDELGVPASKIRLVVATHWHDDHIRGLSSIMRAATSARFACSSALQTDQFFKLLQVGKNSMIAASSGTQEFLELGRIALSRLPKGARPAGAFPDIYAHENGRLFQRSASDGPFPVELWSLSPSAATKSIADARFARHVMSSGAKKRLPANDNTVSVALWLSVGNDHVLLGADLEDHGRPGEGWLGVIDAFTVPAKARIFKVSHHGSPNGENPAIWSTLIESDPVLATTTFLGGRKPRPAPADVSRLCSRSTRTYCTGRSVQASPHRRDPMVEREMDAVAQNRTVLHGPTGHIRIRFTPGGKAPRIDTRRGALRLCSTSTSAA
jgi:hypothetical protein